MRRIRFSSSRTLPGQACGFSRSSAAGVDGLGRQALAVGAQQEGAGQVRDVLDPLAQRRQAHAARR